MIQQQIDAAISNLHHAAQQVSNFEANDYAYSQPGGREQAKVLRRQFADALTAAESLGIDVHAQLKGKGYLI